ncbi:hypothetical protein CL614_10435 [archaeon]|nr:hypothetical protein [archaeon]|tara:strand:- start:1092 stop:1433 length:342 start_codon:yes stop_codon:yes gene_type:complete
MSIKWTKEYKREHDRKYSREYRRENPKWKKASNQKFLAENPNYYNEYIKAHPEQNRARATVARLLKNGKLTKELCVKCGEEKVDGHHPDYNKPAEVIWLCRLCHREIHRINQS